MIPKTFLNVVSHDPKVTFLFVSSDATVNAGLINYAFYLATIW